MNRKIRVLALCDAPTSATGFAQVSRNILNGLAKTGLYEIDVIGINYNGDYYDREKFPYNIYPACPANYADMYGRGRLLDAINGVEVKNNLIPSWDIIFTIQDPFIIEGAGVSFPLAVHIKTRREMFVRTLPKENWFKWIGYFPVDSDLKENWVTKSIALADVPVAYCDYGKKEMLKFDRKEFDVTFQMKLDTNGSPQKVTMKVPNLKDRLKAIPHGVDTNVFKPLSKSEITKFRKNYFNGIVKDDTYLVVNISRNQPRKDLARTLKVFADFKALVPNSFLYLHCKDDDLGGSIHELARNFGLILGEDYSVPKEFDAGIGFAVDIVNMIYNAADLCITTTLGEGWGFINTEAMATKTPIAAPYITSMIDIFSNYDPTLPLEKQSLRGIPARAGTTSSEWTCLGFTDNERIRPLTNVSDMVNKMFWAYSNPDEVKKITDRAYEWVQNLDWTNVVKQWNDLFLRTFNELEEERKKGTLIDTTNRNDPCPCGSKLKFKKCHGGPLATDKFRDWFVEEKK